MAKLISGKIVSVKVRNEVKKETEELRENHGIVPGLAVILVGNDQHLKFMFVTSSVPARKSDFIRTNTA